MRTDGTPGRLRWRLGVFRTLAIALAGAVVGCDAVDRRETLELDTTEVQLESGSRIHDVHVGGAGARDTIAPAQVAASPGDVVRFIVDDHRTHALAFVAGQLSPEARAFLEETQQLLGPPLVNEGAAWVVSFQDAPPGRYPFFCRSHDRDGVVVIE